jgi:hypothetical protein
MKIRPVGAKLFDADGRTHTITLIVVFLNFAKAPKKDGQSGKVICINRHLKRHATFYPTHLCPYNMKIVFKYTNKSHNLNYKTNYNIL